MASLIRIKLAALLIAGFQFSFANLPSLSLGDKSTNSEHFSGLWSSELYEDQLQEGEKENEYVNVNRELVHGGAGRDHLTVMLPESDSTMYIAGYSKSRISGNKETQTKGLYDYWLIKTDADGNKIWENVYGGDHNDKLSSAIITKDGNILLAGSSRSAASGDKSEPSRGDYDYWIVMVNPDGNLLWEKTYGGNRHDVLVEIIELEQGGYLLGGTSNSDASGEKSEGVFKWGGDAFPSDYWVIRVDPKGNKVWDRTLGDNDREEFKSAVQDLDGAIYVAGDRYVWGHRTFIVKLNLDGKIIWDKVISYTEDMFGEYISGDIIVETALAKNGNIEIYSQVEQNISKDPYLTEPFLLRYEITPEGNNVNGKGTRAAFLLEDILVNPEGGYYASLSNANLPKWYQIEFPEQYGLSDYTLAKLDDNFNILWQTTFGGAEDDLGTSLAISPNGSILLGGTSRSGRNPEGHKMTESFGEDDIWILEFNDRKTGIDSLVITHKSSDGGYYLAGNSSSQRSLIKSERARGGMDYWIRKFDSNHNQVWDRTLGGSQDDFLTDIHELRNGNLAVAGYSKSNRYTSDLSGSSDLWIVMLDETGKILWDRAYGGSGAETGGYIHENSDGGLLIGGTSDSPRSGDKLQPSIDPDYWLIRTDPAGEILWERTWQQEGEQRMTDLVWLSNDEIAFAGIDRLQEVDYFRYNQRGWRRNAVEIEVDNPQGRFMILEREKDVVVGGTQRNSYGDLDFTAFAFEEWGEIKWKRNYGGLGDEYLASIMASGNDGFLLSGISTSGLSKDRNYPQTGSLDFWVADISPFGYITWDTTSYINSTVGGGLLLSLNDSLLLAGTIDDEGYEFATSVIGKPVYPEYEQDNWITKIGKTGSEIPEWAGFIPFRSTKAIRDGVVLAGRAVVGEGGYKTQPDEGIWTLGVNNDGWVTWDRTFPTSMDLVSLLTAKRGYFLGLNTADGNIRVIYIDRDGKLIWDKQYGNNSNDNLIKATVDTKGQGIFLITASRYLHIGVDGEIIWTRDHEIVPYFTWRVETLPGTGYVVAMNNRMMKLDPFGNEIWNMFDTEEDELWGLSRSEDGGHFSFYSRYNVPGEDYVITALRRQDKNGRGVWSETNNLFASAVGFSSFTKHDLGFVLFAPTGQYAEFDPNGTMLYHNDIRYASYDISYMSEKDTLSYAQLLFDYDSYSYVLAAKPYAKPVTEALTTLNASDDIFTSQSRIFPNPASEQLWIGGEDIVPDKVEIRDLAGRTYKLNIRQENGRIRVETSPLASGIYLLTVRSAERNETYRFIKE